MVADKMTNCVNWEQLGILIRYIYQQKPAPRLTEYVKSDKIKGEAQLI